jgi:hypothetical protein
MTTVDGAWELTWDGRDSTEETQRRRRSWDDARQQLGRAGGSVQGAGEVAEVELTERVAGNGRRRR